MDTIGSREETTVALNIAEEVAPKKLVTFILKVYTLGACMNVRGMLITVLLEFDSCTRSPTRDEILESVVLASVAVIYFHSRPPEFKLEETSRANLLHMPMRAGAEMYMVGGIAYAGAMICTDCEGENFIKLH